MKLPGLPRLSPDLYVSRLTAIPLDLLQGRGLRGLVIDLDNTVTEWNQNHLRPDVAEWFSTLAASGFRIVLVSNNSEERACEVGRRLGVACLGNAGKPRRGAYRRAMQLMETSPDETAVVGDQIFTDILGGRRMGLFTILVVPLSRREFIGTRLMRLLEWLVLRRLQPERD